MTPRDDLSLFSEEELAAAIARFTSRENGKELALEVAAIPAAERPFYRWSHEVVLLASTLGPGVAERVRRYYGRDEETRALIASQQEAFGLFLVRMGEPQGGARYTLDGVAINVKPGAPPNLVSAYLAPRRQEGTKRLLDLASEDELRAALALRAPDENARTVAAAVYAIPPEQQVHHEWTHYAIMLLSCVSDSLAERVRACFAVLPEEREEFERQQRAYAESLRSQRHRREGCFEIGDIVYDARSKDAL